MRLVSERGDALVERLRQEVSKAVAEHSHVGGQIDVSEHTGEREL